jgi:hypothetical protein
MCKEMSGHPPHIELVYIPSKKAAKEVDLRVSSYLERLAEREMERHMDDEDGNNVNLTRVEIQRRWEEADDL